MTGGAEGLKIGRIRIRSHINLNFILQQSLTAFGGAPFTQGSLSRYHAFGLLDKPKFHAPSMDSRSPFRVCSKGALFTCGFRMEKYDEKALWEQSS